MELLVTGGNGFIGSNLAATLQREGHAVTVVDRTLSPRSSVLRGFPGQLREADVSDPAFWETLEPFDAVLHQAACTDTTVMDRAFMFRQNVEAFQYLLAWARRVKADVIYASSAAVYGNAPSPQRAGEHELPLNPYGESKLAMDAVTRALLPAPPVKIIGLRYFNVYGPGEERKDHMASMVYRLARQMRDGKRPRIFTDGTQRRDQIYVEDTVQANLRALQAPREKSGIYNVGTGNPVSFNQIIAALNVALGLSLEPDYFANPYPFYQNHTQADITTTREALAFSPAYDLQRGVADYTARGPL